MTIRVRLQPLPALSAETQSDEPRAASGLRVSLLRRGAGKTLAKRGSAQPATLTFVMTLFSRVRTPDPSAPKDVATLVGTLQLAASNRQPIFNSQPGPDGTVALQLVEPLDAAPSGAASPARRRLSLEFDPTQFPDLLEPIDLVLPSSTEDGFHYAELSARLEIAQQVEGSEQANDILDVLLTGDGPEFLPAFEARIVDELGAPIDGIEVTLEHDGQVETQTTDAKGAVRLFAPASNQVLLKFADVAALKAKLKPRWNDVRVGPRVHPSQNVISTPVREAITSVALERGIAKVISLTPQAERLRFIQFFFDTSKTFMLPGDPDTLAKLNRVYQRNSPSKLLIVGHADSAGGSAYNDKLSVERAETMLAYLTDDVDGWLKWYGNSIPQEKRWGSHEDLAMIGAMPDADQRDPGEAPVNFYQRTRKLKVDGIAGPNTRRQLVSEYMSLDKTRLPASIAPTLHGCGENFPALITADGVAVQANRRVELFFFDDDLGIQPAPSGKNSGPKAKDYPEWDRRARATENATAGLRALVIKLLDALNEPLPFAPYQIVVGEEQRRGKSDERGLVHEANLPVPNRVTLSWSYPTAPNQPEQDPEPFLFTRKLFLDYADPDEQNHDEGARRRFSNLGYKAPLLQDNVSAFQRDFGLPAAQWFDQATFDKLKDVHDQL